MDIKVEPSKTIDMLTKDSVSILTQYFGELNGVKSQVGGNERKAYINSESGRKELENEQPVNVVGTVMTMWGDTPTIVIDNEE